MMMFVTNNRVVGGERRRRIARMDCLYTLAARKHGEWMNCTANLSALERHELGFRMFFSRHCCEAATIPKAEEWLVRVS